MVGGRALQSRAISVTRKATALNIIFENLWEVVLDDVRHNNQYCLNSVRQNGNIRVSGSRVIIAGGLVVRDGFRFNALCILPR